MNYKCKMCGAEWWKSDETPVLCCPECGSVRMTQTSDDDKSNNYGGLY